MVFNHYSPHSHSLRFYSKVLTALLSCKVLSMYSAYAQYSLCALHSESTLVLEILHHLSKSVYETLFLGTFCAFSCGLVVVTETLSRTLIKVLAIMVTLIFLLLGSEALLNMPNQTLLMGLETFVWIFCLVMSYFTYKKLRKSIHETEILHLFPIYFLLTLKKGFFHVIFCVIQLYFLFSFLFHSIFPVFLSIFTAISSEKLTILLSCHESLELLSLAVVYSVYMQAVETPGVDLCRNVSGMGTVPLYVAGGSGEGDWERPVLVRVQGEEVMVGYWEGWNVGSDF